MPPCAEAAGDESGDDEERRTWLSMSCGVLVVFVALLLFDVSRCLCVWIYIYIYIYREREIMYIHIQYLSLSLYIYIYVYTSCTHIYIYTHTHTSLASAPGPLVRQLRHLHRLHVRDHLILLLD